MYGRECKRFRCAGKVLLAVQNKRYLLPASLVDVGAGGFRIQSLYPMAVNESVEFSIADAGSSAKLGGSGIIRHARIAAAGGVTLCTYGVAYEAVSRAAVKSFLTRVFGVRPRSLFDGEARADARAVLKAAPALLLAGWLVSLILWQSDLERLRQRQRDQVFFDAMISFLNRAE